jgi:DNA-binding NtrC family response regulator
METSGASAERNRILIVDDEPPLLKLMSLYLRRLGYSVTTLEQTQQASALTPAEMQDFAVAVLDATMEGISLDALAEKLLRANGKLCVLASSGYPVDMRALEATAPGRVAFLHKPFTPEMLADAVRRMIGPEEKKGV